MKALQLFSVVLFGAVLVSCRSVQDGKRLIKTSEDDSGTWMTEEEVFGLINDGKTFIDVTNSQLPAADSSSIRAHAVPTELRFQEIVRRVSNNVDSTRVQEFVRHFSSYHTRYHASETGRSSQYWLLSQAIGAAMNYSGDVHVTEFDHGYPQRSVIARLEGVDPNLKNERVIFGAHLDSVNGRGNTLQAPGADDNASGSAVVLETLRNIVEAGIRFNRTVEFHWYAAEEIGLVGSQEIANEYNRTNVNVVAMLNMDVVGHYVSGTDDIGVFTDNGNVQLMQFLRILTNEYLTFGWRDRTCGYGCSDHASWTRAGFPAVMASEVVPNPQMHTVNDVIENMNFNQVNEFCKLAVGYIIEMAEPVTTA